MDLQRTRPLCSQIMAVDPQQLIFWQASKRDLRISPNSGFAGNLQSVHNAVTRARFWPELAGCVRDGTTVTVVKDSKAKKICQPSRAMPLAKKLAIRDRFGRAIVGKQAFSVTVWAQLRDHNNIE